MRRETHFGRRAFIAGAAALAIPAPAWAFRDPAPASDSQAAGPAMGDGHVSLFASHTGESLDISYRYPWGGVINSAYAEICWLLRDFHRNDEVQLRPMKQTVIGQMTDGLDFMPQSRDDEKYFVDKSKLDWGRVPWTDFVKQIDIRLLDLLSQLQKNLGGKRLTILSAYRSARTNETLRENGGGAAVASQHMRGMATDVQPPCGLSEFHQMALAMRAGGVGFYPGNGFVHVDVGLVRSWRG